jgi:hypothetical protein
MQPPIPLIATLKLLLQLFATVILNPIYHLVERHLILQTTTYERAEAG